LLFIPFFFSCLNPKAEIKAGGFKMNKEVFIGKRFGKLTVIAFRNKHHFGNSWLCKCDCGNEKVICESHLLGTKSRLPDKSCGCKHNKQNGNTQTQQRLYSIWKQMIRRCNDSNAINYERYGGKGITVCAEWANDFESFVKWSLGNGYEKDLTIDRKDSSKDYNSDNCRWVTFYEQQLNKGLNKRNKIGYTGVCTSGKGYRSYISRHGVKHYLGWFRTIPEAVEARAKAEKELS
jgi:hypothetical protein